MTTENYNCGDLDLLYSNDDCPRVDDYFTVQKWLMAFMGQNPHKLNELLPKCMRDFGLGFVLTRLYSAFVMGSSFTLALQLTKTTYDSIVLGDLEGMCDALTMMLIYSVSFFSTAYVYWYLQPLLKFMTVLNQKHRHHSMAGLTFVTYYKPYRKVKRFAVIWVMMCLFAVLAWSAAPILLRKRTLPFKCWYPFDVMVPIVYEINYFIQVFGQINTGSTFSISSGLFLTFVVLLLSQFDVLYCSIKNLNFHAKLLCGEDLNLLRNLQAQMPFRANDEMQQYLLLEEHKADLKVFTAYYAKMTNSQKLLNEKAALHESLKECIFLHRFLLKACNQLEKFYHPYNFAITLQCTIQLCTLVFAAVSGENSMIRIFNQIQYFCLTLFNLTIFTYSGELLSQQSVRSNEAFMRTQWTPWNVHAIRRDVLIFLMNSNHVVRLTAAKFYTMDITHLRKTLTQVFSLFTLLRKINEKKNN